MSPRPYSIDKYSLRFSCQHDSLRDLRMWTWEMWHEIDLFHAPEQMDPYSRSLAKGRDPELQEALAAALRAASELSLRPIISNEPMTKEFAWRLLPSEFSAAELAMVCRVPGLDLTSRASQAQVLANLWLETYELRMTSAVGSQVWLELADRCNEITAVARHFGIDRELSCLTKGHL